MPIREEHGVLNYIWGELFMRQVIIARKDLGMSPGKLAAQCCHASLAFLISGLREDGKAVKCYNSETGEEEYVSFFSFPKDVFEGWINGIFTKTICAAKNSGQLTKAINIANDLGLKEGEDYFLIYDRCLTELTPEETDENGSGRTLTCIGFRPLPDDIAHKISKKFQPFK